MKWLIWPWQNVSCNSWVAFTACFGSLSTGTMEHLQSPLLRLLNLSRLYNSKAACVLVNSFYSLYHIIDYKLLTDSLWKPQIPKLSHLLLSVLQMTIYGCHCKPLHGVFILSLILDLRPLSHISRDWLVTGWHGQHLICPFWAPCCDHLWSYATVFIHGHPAFCFLRMYWIVNVTTPNLLCFLWWISVVF